jgi:hypothetical protein
VEEPRGVSIPGRGRADRSSAAVAASLRGGRHGHNVPLCQGPTVAACNGELHGHRQASRRCHRSVFSPIQGPFTDSGVLVRWRSRRGQMVRRLRLSSPGPPVKAKSAMTSAEAGGGSSRHRACAPRRPRRLRVKGEGANDVVRAPASPQGRTRWFVPLDAEGGRCKLRASVIKTAPEGVVIMRERRLI